ncbi:hypothetical protein [Streptomyces sp. BSP1]|uniref:hypothetical protein n=1 Tax=Streptomyces sp. BSP1 TaxID=2944804 RepID=UPI00211EB0B5|nr:hypothetical protein [Streptomyces sp. BSP1]MCQ9706648.1 hypothetical protein [Streptomyces sp. BSP1]
MTSLPARRGETPDGGRPLVIFIDEVAAVLVAPRSLPLPFPTRLVRRDLSNGTKEDR